MNGQPEVLAVADDPEPVSPRPTDTRLRRRNSRSVSSWLLRTTGWATIVINWPSGDMSKLQPDIFNASFTEPLLPLPLGNRCRLFPRLPPTALSSFISRFQKSVNPDALEAVANDAPGLSCNEDIFGVVLALSEAVESGSADCAFGRNAFGKLFAREIKVSRTCRQTSGDAWGWIDMFDELEGDENPRDDVWLLVRLALRCRWKTLAWEPRAAQR